MRLHNPFLTRVFAAAPILLTLTFAIPSPSSAGTHDNQPKILVHVGPTVTKNACTAGALSDCATAVTRGDLTPLGGPGYYFIYLHAARGTLSGLAGLQCGIHYQNGEPADMTDQTGIDIFGWTLCATLEFVTPGANEWPRPGGGNLITWDSTNNCQLGETGVAGYFYAAAYSVDTFQITPRPVDSIAKVANCQNSETNLTMDALGCAHFSNTTTTGCNPCVQNCFGDPVEETTWSRIKSVTGK